MKRETLERLLSDRAAKRTVVLATNLASGAEQLIYPLEDSAEGDVDTALLEAARKTVRSDRSASVEGEDGETFLHVFNPPLRLLIVGAVHIAQPLSQMAAIAGYDVVVIDPRGAFATDARFPGVELVPEWPDEGLEALALDHRTAVVTLTHDPKLDDPALTVALKSEVFYIGSLGSNKTHAARLERLRGEGIEEDTLGRINGPIGLHIGAKSPAEIALAIMAQVTAALRQPT
jgi:xanthine dehydrogenase accessory factor